MPERKPAPPKAPRVPRGASAKKMPQRGVSEEIKPLPKRMPKASVRPLEERSPKPRARRVPHPKPYNPRPFAWLREMMYSDEDIRRAMEILDRMAHHGRISPMDRRFIDHFFDHPVTDEEAYDLLVYLQHKWLRR